MNPNDEHKPLKFEGTVYLTVICKFSNTEASSKDDLAQEIRSTIKNKLNTLHCDVEIEDVDMIETTREPGFWERVDDAYQHQKENM